MKRKFFQLVMLLLFTGVMSVNAQVRIGSNDEPHGGSILDLSNAGNFGMLLPRVLLDAADVFKLSGDVATATGMVVYNTNAAMVNGYGTGVYVWDGVKWNIVGQGTTDPFIPGDYGTPDGTICNPLISGITCIDVRAGQPNPGTQPYVVTETGSGAKTIKGVVWAVNQSTQGLLVSNGVSGADNTTQNLVFKSQAELLALAASADQTIALLAYIEYSDGTKVRLSKTVKIQNRICCPGYLIENGAFTGSIPGSIGTGLSVTDVMISFSGATRQDLCVGPDFGASRSWNSVTGSFCNASVHSKGDDWNDGNNTWRLPNIAELANMQQYKASIPDLAALFGYWSGTTSTYTGDSTYAAIWYFYGSGDTNHYSKSNTTASVYVRCVRNDY
ncbi:MAG: DUF1566 domain-containing protein [Dysgonamonadaceae bacterium]|jgi:hypothetical protein|nr:DUF1566 domain-containing protein [Dysgonamonadaceae bacterium]